MTEIPLELVEEFLSDLTISQIDATEHYRLRSKQRNIPDQWISDCLIDKKPLEITNEKNNKFLLYYDYPKLKEQDLIIVVAIDFSTKHITIITTYKQNIEVRLGQDGQE